MGDHKKKDTSLTKKRSGVLFLLGIPMMYIASFCKDNIVCLMISTLYVLLLLVNGIACFPLVADMIKKQKKDRSE